MIFSKKSQNEEAAKQQRELIITYKRAFSSAEGKVALYDLMDRYHMLNTHKGDDFKEGQRSVVLYILSQCNINLVEFDKLLKGENE